ncbi:MAG: ParB/RepB/Spo0J family partition protein [Mucilaginibacter polytrichastri]|nr:ParB/RepB/Spo0J family partition protein [Mucilaginibacter polytrichastri]
MSAEKRKALGKGLSALLNDSPSKNTETSTLDTPPQIKEGPGAISHVPVEAIQANPFQPRSEFDREALQELADSIIVQGLIQPVTVRQLGKGKYQLISGERRLRASKLAGLKEIPAYIRTANDQQMLEMALIENIQRENLNAIEVALSFQRMIDECSLKQDELGERVGKNRSTVTNYLRLLRLPPAIQASIRDQQISMGHARALINIDDPVTQLYIYRETLDKGLSVRKVEELVRSLQSKPVPAKKTGEKGLSFQVQKIQDDLASRFSARVKVKMNTGGKGSIEIPFLSQDDFNRILEMLDW